jgi:hypothetical protein
MKPRNREVDMSENVSRRKVLSLLGLGATLGFAAASVLEPLVAHAQEASPVPNPTAPDTGGAEPAETKGKKRRARRSKRRTGRHERRRARHAAKPAATAPAATAPAQ